MTSFKKILVPLDFAPPSRRALSYACDLARRYEASMTLAHVYQVVAYPVLEGAVLFTPDQLVGLLERSNQLLSNEQRAAAEWGATHLEARLLQGSPVEELLRVARAESFDLIVMGTHGRKGLDHVIMGSVAERVVRHAPCPVLVVGPQAPAA